MTHRKSDQYHRVSRTLLSGIASFTLLLLANTQSLAQGSVAAGQAKALSCAACHGIDGNSVTPDWPSLAGQHANYTARQLHAFQSGDRSNVLMDAFASTLTDADIDDLSAYFATLPAIQRGADPDLVGLGQRIYRGGLPDRGIAACIACHGPAGRGNPLAAYPVIRGQHAAYLVSTLRAYAAGERRSDNAANLMMQDIAVALREEEMQAVASYIQGLR